MKRILVINGPNLNLLGKREPEIYGSESLEDIQRLTVERLKSSHPDLVKSLQLTWFQSNIEGEIVSEIQKGLKDIDGIIINPGAFTHTSIAIYDALLSIKIPKVEVHLSNTHKREGFRTHRITSKGVDGLLEGLGKDVYYLGIIYLGNHLLYKG